MIENYVFINYHEPVSAKLDRILQTQISIYTLSVTFISQKIFIFPMVLYSYLIINMFSYVLEWKK